MGRSHSEEYDRYRDIFRDERLPLAFVDLEKFDRNIAFVASTQRQTGKTVRVHSKSIRCVELLRRILDKGGDAFRGVMTFTMEETAFLADKGFDDFIVSYPTVQPTDLDLFAGLIRAGNPDLRAVLIELAHRLIRSPGTWSSHAQQMLKRGKARNVVVAAIANR